MRPAPPFVISQLLTGSHNALVQAANPARSGAYAPEAMASADQEASVLNSLKQAKDLNVRLPNGNGML